MRGRTKYVTSFGANVGAHLRLELADWVTCLVWVSYINLAMGVRTDRPKMDRVEGQHKLTSVQFPEELAVECYGDFLNVKSFHLSLIHLFCFIVDVEKMFAFVVVPVSDLAYLIKPEK